MAEPVYVDSDAVPELTGAITETVVLNIASGTDLMLVVGIPREQASGQTVDSVTYNGDALTEHPNSPFVNGQASSFNEDIAVFYLLNPDTGGDFDLVVTFSGATGQDVVIIPVVVSSASALGASGQNSPASTPVGTDRSVSITTANDDSLILAFACSRVSQDSPYSSSTGTEREDGATATGTVGTAYALYTQAAGAAGAKTVTITGGDNSTTPYNTVAIEVVEAVAGGATHPVNPFGHPLQGPFAGPIGF